MQNAPLITNHVTIDILERLYFSESKPRNLKPIDLAVLTYLALRRCEDHEISDSQLTIAQRVRSERKTVARSLERLEKLKWVTVGGHGVGRTKGTSINADAFPAAQPLRDKLTPDAKTLAGRYMLALQKMGIRKFPKNWLKRQVPSAQRILTACGGRLDMARAIVSHALSDKTFKKRASTSLYNLLTILPQVIRSFEQKHPGTKVEQEVIQKGKQANDSSAIAA